MFTSVLACVTAYFQWIAKKDLEDVNDAVNHRHKRGEDSPKLYDAVLHLHERADRLDEHIDELVSWKRSYDGGPLDNGQKVIDFVRNTNEIINKMAGDVKELRDSCPEGGRLPCHYLTDKSKQKENET